MRGPAPDLSPYLAAALKVDRWLRSTLIPFEHGPIWPEDAAATEPTPGADLATGAAGVTLFYLDLYRRTGEVSFLAEARRGADYLLAVLPAEMSREGFPPREGFYYGLGGIAFVLHEVGVASGDDRYRRGALGAVERIHDSATEGATASWSTYNDLLFGDAGTGLFLLYAARRMEHLASRDLAIRVGRALLEDGIPREDGLAWPLSDDAETELPNFSHGAAGIGYFLTSLYIATGDEIFLDGARRAARHLEAIARRDEGVFLVPYGLSRPEWEDRYEIGWAHGGAGTARLFFHLFQATDHPPAMQTVLAAALGIRRSGVPDRGRRAEPFRLDRRFGVAGVAEFFLDLYRETGEPQHLAFARRLTDHILLQSAAAEDGLFWMSPRYDFMEEPGRTAAFTGYFHGAAGFGLLLMDLAGGADAGGGVRLPDDPF